MNGKVRLFSTALVGVGMVLAGCGRTVHNNLPGGESAMARPHAVDFVEVSWPDVSGDANSNKHAAENGWATMDGIHYISDLPISIPGRLPDSLEFKLGIPKRFARLTLAFHADFLNGDGSALGVLGQNISRESNSVEFQLSGAPGVLGHAVEGNVGERKAILHVVGTDPSSGQTMFEGKMGLVTPPTRIEVVQESIGTFEKRSGSLEDSQKFTSLGGVGMSLLQVLTFHNPSDVAIDIVLPSQLNGSLLAHFQNVSVEVGQCSYSARSSLSTRTLSGELHVALLQNGQTFVDPEGEVRVSIPPQSNALAGIYSAGKEAQEVAQGTYEAPALDDTDVIDSCQLTCGGRAFRISCGDLELTPHHAHAKSGTQALPITVEIGAGNRGGELSFRGTNDQGDPEAASFPIFAAVSVQRE